MQLLITERNDITPLLGMDWLNKFKSTIGNIRVDENRQWEKREIPGPIPKQYDHKRCGNKHTIETGTLSGETKSKTNPSPLTRSCRKKIEKSIKSGHLEKVKQVDEEFFYHR